VGVLPGDSLPCLNSNNSIEFLPSDYRNPLNFLSPYHRKQALVQCDNAERFIRQIGIDRVGFLTLTFADNVTDNGEASRRFNSLNSNTFDVFGSWLLVKERQVKRGLKNGDSGAWHYHLLVDVKKDIRSGFDWDSYAASIELRKARKPYRDMELKAFRSANQNLRELWSYLRNNLPKYNFGRHELLPIRTNAEATGKYIGKYVSKHIENRISDDKGVRLFSCSKDLLRSSTKFSWNTENSKEWRRKLKVFAHLKGCETLDELSYKLGPKWVYKYWFEIMGVDYTLINTLKKIPF
jgi:hypothetical protein